ncbi:MAG: hypothetical protein RL007_3045 [Bacteroidota bacterium]|jgi:hypothetical protein
MKLAGKIFVLAMLMVSALNFHLRAQNITIKADKTDYKTSDEIVITLSGELSDFTQYASLPPVSGLTPSGTDQSFDNAAPGKKIRIRQTFRYFANQTGEFEIGPAVIYSGTKQYYSNTITINVAQDSRFEQEGLAFMKAEIPRKTFFIGERIPVYFRIYYRDNYTCENSSVFAPKYDGFWHPDVTGYFDQNFRNDSLVVIKGRQYNSRIFAVDYIYPNASGKLKIPEYNTTATLTEITDGYNAFSTSIDLSSPVLSITVNDLPPHDSLPGYNGDVGTLNFSCTLSSNTTEEWNPLRMKVTVSGKTNFSMMIPPTFSLPAGFRMELVKSYDSISVEDIESASKIFEYNLIAEKQGDYVLNGIAYSFFNPIQEKYITIYGDTISLHVNPGTKIDPDSESNLPDTFLSAKSRLPFALVVVFSVVAGITVVVYLILRFRKKSAAKKSTADQAIEEPEPVQPVDTSREQAFAQLNSAKLILRNGQCAQSIESAYQALLLRVCRIAQLKPHEASTYNLKYKLGKIFSDVQFVDSIIQHLEDLKLRKYSIKGSDFDLAAQLLQKTEKILISLN